MWFIKGDTNARHLSNNGIRIWNSNSSREFLDTVGLHNNQEGDCGPIYGFQWRRFNAKYTGCDAAYSSSVGVDQLDMCIELIKK